MQTQNRRTALRSLLAAMALAGLDSTAIAGAGCCSNCRCQTRCRKVCRLVQEEKKITTTCWGMECEDFCVPGPSTPDCKHCEMIQPKGKDDKKICASAQATDLDVMDSRLQRRRFDKTKTDEEDDHYKSAIVQVGRRRPVPTVHCPMRNRHSA